MDLRDEPRQANDVQMVRNPASFWAPQFAHVFPTVGKGGAVGHGLLSSHAFRFEPA